MTALKINAHPTHLFKLGLYAFIALACVLLTSCATRAPLLKIEQVTAEQSTKTLEGFLSAIINRPADVKLSADEELAAHQLKSMLRQRYDAMLSSANLNDGTIKSLDALSKAKQVAQRLKAIDEKAAQPYFQLVEQNEAKTKGELENRLSSAEHSEGVKYLDFANHLTQASALSLTGSQQASEILQWKDRAILNIYLSAQQSFDAGYWEQAQEIVDAGLILDSSNDDLKQLSSDVINAQRQSQINEMLNLGQLDELEAALNAWKTNAVPHRMPEEQKQRVIEWIRQRQDALFKQNRLTEAVRLAQQKLRFWPLLNESSKWQAEDNTLLQRLFDCSRYAANEGFSVIEFGILSAIHSIDPSFPELEDIRLIIEAELKKLYAPTVLIRPFSYPQKEEVGQRLSEALGHALKASFLPSKGFSLGQDDNVSKEQALFLLRGNVDNLLIKHRFNGDIAGYMAIRYRLFDLLDSKSPIAENTLTLQSITTPPPMLESTGETLSDSENQQIEQSIIQALTKDLSLLVAQEIAQKLEAKEDSQDTFNKAKAAIDEHDGLSQARWFARAWVVAEAQKDESVAEQALNKLVDLSTKYRCRVEPR